MKAGRTLTLIAGLLFAAACRGAPVNVTIYADEGYPPYSFVQGGKPAGLYYEIVKAALARMPAYRATIEPVPWKRGMAMLKQGNAFALYPPYLNTRDEPWTWPYSLPLYDEHVVAICRKDVLGKHLPMRWPQDFYGMTIGNNAGFIVGGVEFTDMLQAGKIRMEEGKDNRTNILKLGMKRIDCYINDRVSILWTKQQMQAAGQYDEGGAHAVLVEAAVIGVEQGFLGFTDRDQGQFAYKTDFVKQFDAAIYQMKRSGEIHRIAEQFFHAKNIHIDDTPP